MKPISHAVPIHGRTHRPYRPFCPYAHRRIRMQHSLFPRGRRGAETRSLQGIFCHNEKQPIVRFAYQNAPLINGGYVKQTHFAHSILYYVYILTDYVSYCKSF